MGKYFLDASWKKASTGRTSRSYRGTCAESLIYAMTDKELITDTELFLGVASLMNKRLAPDEERLAEANKLLSGLLQVYPTEEGLFLFTGPAIANTPLVHAAILFCRDGFSHQRAILGLLPNLLEQVGYDHNRRYRFETSVFGSQRFLTYCVDPRLWAEDFQGRVEKTAYARRYNYTEPIFNTMVLSALGCADQVHAAFLSFLEVDSLDILYKGPDPNGIRTTQLVAHGFGPRNVTRKMFQCLLKFSNDWFCGLTFLGPHDLDQFNWTFSKTGQNHEWYK